MPVARARRMCGEHRAPCSDCLLSSESAGADVDLAGHVTLQRLRGLLILIAARLVTPTFPLCFALSAVFPRSVDVE